MKNIIKNILLLIVSIIYLNQAFAVTPNKHQEQVTNTKNCWQKYWAKSFDTEMGRDRFNDLHNSHLTSYSLLGLFIGGAVGSLPVAIGLGLAPTVISEIKNLPSKEERVLMLITETNKKLSRFTKKMQNKISPYITEDEVRNILFSGFNNGHYCSNGKRLASPRKIRSYITDVLITHHLSKNLELVTEDLSDTTEKDCEE